LEHIWPELLKILQEDPLLRIDFSSQSTSGKKLASRAIASAISRLHQEVDWDASLRGYLDDYTENLSADKSKKRSLSTLRYSGADFEWIELQNTFGLRTATHALLVNQKDFEPLRMVCEKLIAGKKVTGLGEDLAQGLLEIGFLGMEQQ
jgi:hypothetical protein